MYQAYLSSRQIGIFNLNCRLFVSLTLQVNLIHFSERKHFQLKKETLDRLLQQMKKLEIAFFVLVESFGKCKLLF